MERLSLHLDQLVINPDINPRHASDAEVGDLVAQIRANGFTDPLWVRPLSQACADAQGLGNIGITDLYEVIDGSRRLRAVREVADALGITTIPVDVMEADDARARELALAANVARAPLTPADEARAFYALKMGGMDESDIAGHFAVPLPRVRQRLALGQLPDAILDALRAGHINLDTARAFTLTNSRERQLKVFEETRNLAAWNVKDALTAKTVRADDARAELVGLEAYRAAGGTVIEDLFSDAAWLDNEKLLQKLFDDTLKARVKALKDEGWSFVKVLQGRETYNEYQFNTSAPKGRRTLSEAEREDLAALKARADEVQKLIKAYDESDAEEVSEEEHEAQEKRFDERDKIVAAITALTAQPYTEKQRQSLGVLLCLPDRGGLKMKYGVLTPGKKDTAPARGRKDRDPEQDDHAGDDDAPPPEPLREAGFSEAVEVALVKAARDAVKLAMVKDRPALAARLGLAGRVQGWLCEVAADCGVDQEYESSPFVTVQNARDPLDGGATFETMKTEMVKALAKAEGFAGLLALIETFTPEQVTALEAMMAAHWFTATSLRHVDVRAVIDALDPDMRAEGFAIDEAFLGRLSRDQLALVSAEITPDAPVTKGKKPEMVAAILPLISQSGWLPEQLRTPSYRGPGSEDQAEASDAAEEQAPEEKAA